MDFSALFKKKAPEKDSYFGLFLRGESAVGFIFEVHEGTISLVAKERIQYSNGWENILDDVDELLAVLENETQVHVNNCIYFVYSYFLDDVSGEIKEPYKDVMKRLSKELDLKPLGYIECHESIKNLLESEDSTPTNSVLIEIDSNHASSYVLKGGKLIHKDQISRTDSIVDDVQAMFEKKKDQYLFPSKVVVYGSTEVEKEVQALKAHSWKEDVFIQAPRFTLLTNEEVLNALSATFIDQLKQEMVGPDAVQDDEPLAAHVLDDSAEGPVQEHDLMAEAEPDKEDIMISEPPKKKVAKTDTDADDLADEMGFLVGEDIADHPDLLSTAEPEEPKKSISMPKLKGVKLPKMKMPKGNKKHAIVAAAALLVVGGVIAGELVFHKSTIEVTLPANQIADSFSLQARVDQAATDTFAVVEDTKTLEINDSIATSGEREVGEKAKGTVILNNFEDKSVTYAAGTKITADSLTYVLDSEVTIASASSTVSSIQAQTKEANVTAEAIGPEYNIGKDKRMSVSGAASRNFAVTKSAFSGGTKKKLNTIAKADIDQLEKRVQEKAKQQSKKEADAAAGGEGMELLPDLTEVDIEETDYSGEVGQEATEVTVKASVAIKLYQVPQNVMKTELADRMKGDVPSGYAIDKSKLSYKIDSAKKDEGTVNVDVLGEATAIKVVDKESMIKEIAGKSLEEVRKLLREKYEVEDVSLKDNATPIFLLGDRLPFRSEKITVQFSSN